MQLKELRKNAGFKNTKTAAIEASAALGFSISPRTIEGWEFRAHISPLRVIYTQFLQDRLKPS